MNNQTTFGFTPAWWTAQNKVSKKKDAPARVVYGALLLAILTAALWVCLIPI